MGAAALVLDKMDALQSSRNTRITCALLPFLLETLILFFRVRLDDGWRGVSLTTDYWDGKTTNDTTIELIIS